MAAEFHDIEHETSENIAETTEPESPRDIDVLLNLDYSEMSEEEIRIVVEYRANIIARDREHQERMNMLREHMAEQAAIHREMAEDAQKRLDELTRHAIDRFESESNG